MTPTLATLVSDDPPSTLRELLDREQRAVSAPTQTRCMNPECQKELSYPGNGTRTRPATYCSATCRRTVIYLHRRFTADLEALEVYRHLPGSTRERRALNRAISIRRWLLQRYEPTSAPGDTGTSTSS